MGATHLFGWAETFADETVRSALAAGKVIKAGKTFVKALTNAFGKRDPLASRCWMLMVQLSPILN
jgi:type I restriction enzyme M protein